MMILSDPIDAFDSTKIKITTDMMGYGMYMARSRVAVRNIRNHITGEPVYPWWYTFDRGMPWQGMGYDT